MKVVTDFIRFWFTSDFFAIGLFAFLGVAIRVGIQNKLTGVGVSDPTSGYGPFIQMFYAQSYLSCNMLGCFIMAMCIVHTKNISAISLPLYKGLSTGLCGSITTLSTWMNVANINLWGHGWYKVIIMIVLEFFITWSAFNMGYAFCKVLDEWYYQWAVYMGYIKPEAEEEAIAIDADSSGNDIELNAVSKTAGVADVATKSSSMYPSAQEKQRAFANALIQQQMQRSSNLGLHQRGSSFSGNNSRLSMGAGDMLPGILQITTRISQWREEGVDEDYEMEYENAVRQSFGVPPIAASGKEPSTMAPELGTIREVSVDSQSTTSSRAPSQADASPPSLDTTKLNTAASSSSSSSASSSAPATTSTTTTGAAAAAGNPAVESSWLSWFHRNEYACWCYTFWTVAIVLWIVLAASPSQPAYFKNQTLRDTYRAIALAPLGAWMRWALTKFPRIKAAWPEMNPQTMAANLFAVTFECCLLVFASTSFVPALNNGINGSCSTVSTFFGEIHNLYFEKGPYVALRYTVTTFALSILIIQIIRGANAG